MCVFDTEMAFLHFYGLPKVTDDHPPIRGQEEVAKLQITMNHTVLLQKHEPS